MSAIFGLCRLDGSPAQSDVVAMQRALQHWGQDGGLVWVEGPVGLGSCSRHITPESVFEKSSMQICAGTVSLIAAARIDNRAELCAAFGLDSIQSAVTSDTELVARAYERWGQDSVQRLLGDWSFVAYHHQSGRWFIARDHYGNTGLHYCHVGNRFTFASGIEGILALEGIPKKPNDLKIAEMMIVWMRDGSSTQYQDIMRLPPAHHLTFENGTLKLERHWKLEDTPTRRLRSSQEYVEGFQSVLRSAVRDRMRSRFPVASTLSAGLDSGAVTVLAAEAARERGQRLTAFTSVPVYEVDFPDPDRYTNEWDLARLTSEFAGNIDHVPVPADHLSPIAAMRRVTNILHEPSFAAGNNYWIQSMLERTRDQGFGVLLTGQVGNGAASFSGGSFVVWHALRHRQFGLAHHAFSSSVLAHGSVSKTWLAEMGLPSVLSFKTLIAALSGTRFDNPEWAVNTPISQALVKRVQLLEQIKKANWLAVELHRLSPRAQMMQALMPKSIPVGATWNGFSGAYGIDIRDPTMDKRLLEFCVGVPTKEFVGQGYSRFLMRRAMQGLLPKEVQWNVKRGVQASDLGKRLRQTAPEVNEAMLELKTQPNIGNYLDLYRLESVWQRIKDNTYEKMEAISLLRAISVGLFLRQFET